MIFGRQGVRNCSIIKPQNSKSLGVQFIHIQRTSDKIIHTKHRQKESPKLWINKINKARGQAWHHRRRWNWRKKPWPSSHGGGRCCDLQWRWGWGQPYWHSRWRDQHDDDCCRGRRTDPKGVGLLLRVMCIG